jgi:nicotinamide mononucleotide transporter
MTQKVNGCLAFAKRFFVSIIRDFKGVAWWAGILLFLFGSLMVIFSIVDFNSLIYPERQLEILKWNNDEAMGIEYWRRVLMSLSGAASFTGAVCVVLTTYGKLSSYFWGVINCILYGLFAFAYGYGGDAQLNIVFFLPMQFWGMYTWKDSIDETDERVNSRKLGILGWIVCLTLGFGVSCGFYFEIPHFVNAIQGKFLIWKIFFSLKSKPKTYFLHY